MDGFNSRRYTKWRNDEVEEVQVPDTIKSYQDTEEMMNHCCIEDEFIANCTSEC